MAFYEYMKKRMKEKKYELLTEKNMNGLENVEKILSLKGNLRILCIMRLVDEPVRIQMLEFFTHLPRTTIVKSLNYLVYLGLVTREKFNETEPRMENVKKFFLTPKGHALFKGKYKSLNIANGLRNRKTAILYMDKTKQLFD